MPEFYFVGMTDRGLYRAREQVANHSGRMEGDSAVEAFTQICVTALVTGEMPPCMEAFEKPLANVEHAVYKNPALFRVFTLEERKQIKQSLRDWGVV